MNADRIPLNARVSHRGAGCGRKANRVRRVNVTLEVNATQDMWVLGYRHGVRGLDKEFETGNYLSGYETGMRRMGRAR